MKVRIRLGNGQPVVRRKGKNRRVALAAAALLAPAVLALYVLGIWRLSTDVGFAGDFEIKEGFFSHWQVWIGLGAALNVVAVVLNRYGRSGEFRPPGKARRDSVR